MIKRTGVFLSLMLAVVPWTARAAEHDVSTGAGAGRCAYAAGKVTNGTAWIDICQGAGADASSSGTSVPTATQDPVISGVVRVQTNLGVDQRPFSTSASSPNQAYITGFVMDPGMNTATITLTISTITVNVTLTAKTQAPEPWNYQSVSHFVHESIYYTDPSVGMFAFAQAGGGMERAATVTGSIRSTSKGGGTLSQPSGSMSSGGGNYLDLCVDTNFCFGGF